MRVNIGLCSLIVVILLPGCAFWQQQPASGDIPIGKQLAFRLPGWQPPAVPVEVIQQLSGQYDGHQFSMQAQLSLTRERVKMVGLDAIGRRGFDISWDRNGLVIETASWLPKRLDPQQILAHIVMAYWPRETVVAALVGSGVAVVDNANSRRISDAAGEVMIIDYANTRAKVWQGRARIVNPGIGYELVILSAEINR